LWEKETTPQMTSIFASNGPQPFTSSTHQRLTFGQHFFGILHWSTIKFDRSDQSDRFWRLLSHLSACSNSQTVNLVGLTNTG
jgi:hypothetical protein